MNPILGETYEMLYEDGSKVENYICYKIIKDIFRTNMSSSSYKSLYNVWS